MEKIKVRKEFATICYPGAFLQTKSNEETEGSYILWEWKKKKFIPTVKKLENIYSTISHNVDELLNKSIETIKDQNQTIVLKYDPSKVSKTDMVNYKKELTSLYKNKFELKPIVKKKQVVITNFTKEETEKNTKLSLQQAFEQYIIKTIPDIEDEVKQKLIGLDKKYDFVLDLSKDFELGDYSLLSITVNNFLPFPPKDITFPFEHEGIYSILGENKVGKTSVGSAIKFCLFNATPHSSTVLKKMINKHNRSKECFVEIFAYKNGKYYKIKRLLTPKKEGVSITLDFDEVDQSGEVIRNIKGEKRQDTEKEIQKIFGTENFFDILTSFSAQKRQIEFIDCKNSERLTLVNRFLGLQSFEDKEKEVANDLKSKKIIYQTYEKEFNKSINLTELEIELEKKKMGVEENRYELQNKELSLAKFIKQNEEFIKHWNKTKNISEKRTESPEEIKNKIFSIDREIEIKKNAIISQENLIISYNQTISLLKETFNKLSKDDIKTWKVNFKENSELQSKFTINEAEVKKLQKQLQIDICNNCGKEFTSEDKLLCKNKIIELLKENIIYQEELKGKELQRDRLINWQTEYNNIGRTLSNAQRDILVYNASISTENNKREKLQTQNNEYEEVIAAKSILNILQPQLDTYNRTKFELDREIIRLNVEIKGNTEQIKIIEKEIIIYKIKLQQLNELEAEITLLKSYKDIIHKDGLPLTILKSKMDDINQQTNVIINQVFDFDIEFEVDEDAGDLNINFVYPEDSESNDVGLASGSETFLINLAIKTGIAQISEIPKMNSLLIDEGFGTLDSKTILKVPQLFEAINKYYRNIIIISHLDEMKDMADHPIKLEKIGKYTEVIS